MNAATMNVNAKVSDLDCTPGRQCVRGEGRRVRARSPGGEGGGCQRRRPAGNGWRRQNFSGRRSHLGQGGYRNWKKCNHGGPHLSSGKHQTLYKSGGTGRGPGAFLGFHCHVGCPQTPGRSGLCLKESVSWLVMSLIQVLTRPGPA